MFWASTYWTTKYWSILFAKAWIGVNCLVVSISSATEWITINSYNNISVWVNSVVWTIPVVEAFSWTIFAATTIWVESSALSATVMGYANSNITTIWMESTILWWLPMMWVDYYAVTVNLNQNILEQRIYSAINLSVESIPLLLSLWGVTTSQGVWINTNVIATSILLPTSVNYVFLPERVKPRVFWMSWDIVIATIL